MKDQNAGIWIDREHATAVLVSDNENELETFHAGVSKPFPQTKESRAEHEYTRNDFVAEDKLERKQSHARSEMYDSILRYVASAEALFIFGPGEAKKEFQKHIASSGDRKHIVEIESSDKVTNPQLIAKIREHFRLSRKA